MNNILISVLTRLFSLRKFILLPPTLLPELKHCCRVSWILDTVYTVVCFLLARIMDLLSHFQPQTYIRRAKMHLLLRKYNLLPNSLTIFSHAAVASVSASTFSIGESCCSISNFRKPIKSWRDLNYWCGVANLSNKKTVITKERSSK